MPRVETAAAAGGSNGVPTYRVIYDPRPGARRFIEDVEADALIETAQHFTFTVDALVINLPREVVVLRAQRRDVTAVLVLCRTAARWGGVLLLPPSPWPRRVTPTCRSRLLSTFRPPSEAGGSA